MEKYGFVRNAAMLKTDYSEDDPSFFIHSSGGMFVCLPDYYTNYYTNRSRHTSSNSMGGASRYNSTVTTANQLGIKAPLLNTKHQVMRTHSEHTSANTPASFQYSASNAKQQDVSDPRSIPANQHHNPSTVSNYLLSMQNRIIPCLQVNASPSQSV